MNSKSRVKSKKVDDECVKENKEMESTRMDHKSYKTDDKRSHAKSSGRNKGSKYRGNSKSDDSGKTPRHDNVARSSNSPDWSKPDPIVMDQATRFSLSNFIGEPINFQFIGETYANSPKPQNFHVGSTCVMSLNPSLGKVGVGADAKVSAINQQGFKLYSRLSSVNSKNTQYGPQDVTTLMLAVGELISLTNWIQRTFGLTWIYNLRNRNMPKYLIKSTGFDPDDFFDNLAQYRIDFNTLMVQANRIPFPSNFNYFMKCSQLYSSIFKDTDTDMAQLYVFRPYSYWIMDETGATGTKLVTTPIPYAGGDDIGFIKMRYALDVLDNMIDTLMTSATYNYIYADILNFASRSYGNTSIQMLNFGTIPEEYVVVPVYDEVMLSQIHNSTIMGAPVSTSGVVSIPYPKLPNTPSNDVIPNENTLCLEYDPCWIHTTQFQIMDRLLNFHVNDPDTDARIEATRLMAGVRDSYVMTGGTFADIGIISSDHYIVQAIVLTDGAQGCQWTLNSSNLVEDSHNYSSLMMQFREMPILYTLTKYVDSTHIPTLTDVWATMDVYTTIDLNTLSRINDLAMYGMFEPRDFAYTGIAKSK